MARNVLYEEIKHFIQKGGTMRFLKSFFVVVVVGIFLAAMSATVFGGPDPGESPKPPPCGDPGNG